MDPLSVVSGVVGLVAIAVQAADAVLALISDIKDAPADIADLWDNIQSLAVLLATTHSLYDKYGKNSIQDAAILGVTLDTCLQRCIGPLRGLLELLKPFADSVKKRSLGRALSSFSWAMKKTAIKGLMDRLKDAKASLTLAVSVLNGYISGKGQEQIQRDIVAGYERLQRDFLDLERSKELKRRLTLDVASARGTEDSQSSEYTDSGLPLRRFLASAQQWSSGNCMLEPPPPVETIASESVSGDDAFESISSPLVEAVLLGDQDAVERLLTAGSSILERSHDGFSLLHLCILTNNCALATYIVDQDTENALLNSKDADRRTPLMLAVDKGCTEVASLLIERGCSLGDFISVAMDLLESGKDDGEIRKLLKPVAKRLRGSFQERNPGRRAITQGKNHNLLDLLLKTDLDTRNDTGIRPIFYDMRAIIRPTWKVILAPGVKDLLLDDVKDFLASEKLYADKRIPFRRGYLLHGVPGSGKRSLIREIAEELMLELYIISLSSPWINDSTLIELVRRVPERAILVLEDIDAAATYHTNTYSYEDKDQNRGGAAALRQMNTLSMDALFNALDMYAAVEGRIVFATTNDLKRLDPAFSRSGRVDMWVEFKNASRWQAEELFRNFFPSVKDKDEDDQPFEDEPTGPGTSTTSMSSTMWSVASSSSRSSDSEERAMGANAEQEKPLVIDTPKLECRNEVSLPLSVVPEIAALQHSVRPLDARTLAALAKRFADVVPEGEFSVAALQGYLLKNKFRPEAAVAGAAAWVEVEREMRKWSLREQELQEARETMETRNDRVGKAEEPTVAVVLEPALASATIAPTAREDSTTPATPGPQSTEPRHSASES